MRLDAADLTVQERLLSGERIDGAILVGHNRLMLSNRRIWLCDSETHETVAVGEAHETRVEALAFSVDQELFASGSTDGTMAVSEAPRGQLQSSWSAHTDAVTGLAFDPVGRVWTTARDGQVKVWVVERGSAREVMAARMAGPIQAMALDSSGSRLLLSVGGTSPTVSLYEISG